MWQNDNVLDCKSNLYGFNSHHNLRVKHIWTSNQSFFLKNDPILLRVKTLDQSQ